MVSDLELTFSGSSSFVFSMSGEELGWLLIFFYYLIELEWSSFYCSSLKKSKTGEFVVFLVLLANEIFLVRVCGVSVFGSIYLINSLNTLSSVLTEELLYLSFSF
jgi:hypothetical protein